MENVRLCNRVGMRRLDQCSCGGYPSLSTGSEGILGIRSKNNSLNTIFILFLGFMRGANWSWRKRLVADAGL